MPDDFRFRTLAECQQHAEQEIDPGLELRLLRMLEKRMRKMFEWTEWAQDCDDEPREAIEKVEQALDDLAAARRIIRAAYQSSGSES